jgi:hypothetical protein
MLPENNLDEKLDDEKMHDSLPGVARRVGGIIYGRHTMLVRVG